MPEIRYSLTLQNDAEPGTGLGTELINDLVPRDERGNPYIPASHLKGVAREELRTIGSALGWPEAFENAVFGKAGHDGSDGEDGAVRFGGSHPSGNDRPPRVLRIARTAISEHGTVDSGSLRTVEAIGADTRFEGCVFVSSDDPAILDAVRLALLSISAIGGNRTRGAGRCTITLVDDPALKPSVVLRRLDASARAYAAPTRARTPSTSPRALGTETTLLELTFIASDPVCCPAVPLTRTNSIRGGFAIPASAVQGTLLHALDRVDHELASSVFASPSFRAWPLLPIAAAGEDAGARRATWTSMTHRMSKTAVGIDADTPFFRDRMIEPFDWRSVPSGAPLKGADGVLLRDGASVALWRASDMPRRLSAHVNLQGAEPDLFAVEAMAPATFRGFVAVPSAAADRLLEALRKEPTAHFGRSKAVRGGGRLSASVVSPDSLLPHATTDGRIFILQSPVLVPRRWIEHGKPDEHGGALLARLVEESGLGKCSGAEASLEFRFGWNRHGQGARVGGTNRLEAEAVFAPGSIFVLERAPADPAQAILAGLGEGRERGFGAMLPHPGIASRLHRDSAATPVLRSRDESGRIAEDLVRRSNESGLSTSAISQLVRKAMEGPDAIESFLNRQKDRPAQQWQRWRPLVERIREIGRDKSISNETRARTFRAWADAATAKGGF
jgi:hypothetical protein